MTDLETLVAKDRIATVVHQLFTATDRRDWPAVRACFADVVDFDMTSLAGGTPARLTPLQITDGWEAGLKPIQHVHHQVGNLEISVHGDAATAFCYGIALHYRAKAT
ncbi:MAG: nuclear transport factor 2 family protein [Betaproteobacteria bacterium]|nr:nuclear transport factor 2 family protein [Betaproteobacteria bacterium]